MSRIDDGHSTTITLTSPTTVKFYEKTVTPPSISGGGTNDTTTMRNTEWRTNAPKKLKTLGDMKLTAAYDPEVYDSILSAVNKNQEITINFPDGSKVKFWGWLDEFQPGQMQEGGQPTADVTFRCSNQNASGAETAPTYTAPVAP